MDEENQKIRIRFRELIKLLEAAESLFRQDLPMSASLTLQQVETGSFNLARDLIKTR